MMATRQRAWQLRQRTAGRCQQCGREAKAARCSACQLAFKKRRVLMTENERKARSQRSCRKVRVASGNCGYCDKPRKSFKWLCDGCAKRHREKQRDEYRKAKEYASCQKS